MRVHIEVKAAYLDEFITKVKKVGADLCFIDIATKMKYRRGSFVFDAFITWAIEGRIVRALEDMLSEGRILSMAHKPYSSKV